jgi:type IV secretory pathway VirB2 component (pilin)
MGFLRVMGWRRAHIIIVVIIIILLAVEIGRSFVFICTSVLRDMSAKMLG